MSNIPTLLTGYTFPTCTAYRFKVQPQPAFAAMPVPIAESERGEEVRAVPMSSAGGADSCMVGVRTDTGEATAPKVQRERRQGIVVFVGNTLGGRGKKTIVHFSSLLVMLVRNGALRAS